ncbi:MAG: VCBS repeat-containing protein, partial [Acidobacteriota bacterium]
MKRLLLLAISIQFTAVTWGQVTFRDVTHQAGINFTHNNGASGKKFLPETMGSGGAFLDYNGDGWLDIFLPNGMDLGKSSKRSLPALFRNNQNGTFTNVTQAAGLGSEFYGMGVAAADYDNDGDVDLYVTSLGNDRFYQNQGDGTFRDVTNSSGLGNPSYGTSAAFLDYDRDGHLDLFVANYVQWSVESDIRCTLDGHTKSYCTPEPYKGATPRLYRNLGNRRFKEVTEEAGLLDNTNKGLGIVVFDYNIDGWPDLMMANDTQPNKLWENQGNGRFREIGVLAGIAFSEDGVARGAMGIDAGDYDRSGYPSVVIGNFSNEMISLYHNERSGFFIDDAPTSAIGPASLLSLTFGCFFFDFDLDGFLDILTVNGHVENEIAAVQKRVTYKQRPQLFRNLNGKTFQDVTAQMGTEFNAPR